MSAAAAGTLTASRAEEASRPARSAALEVMAGSLRQVRRDGLPTSKSGALADALASTTLPLRVEAQRAIPTLSFISPRELVAYNETHIPQLFCGNDPKTENSLSLVLFPQLCQWRVLAV
jgi:hypothetical protein